MKLIFEMAVSIILTIKFVNDFVTSNLNKPQGEEIIHILFYPKTVIHVLLLVLLAGSAAFASYAYSITDDLEMLYIVYWLVLLFVYNIYVISKRGYIYNSGVWFSGSYYQWERIIACEISSNSDSISFVVNKQFISFKYRVRLKLFVPINNRSGIREFLSLHISQLTH